jgi:pimeloyl-ACP methyl ester carboxylesterase
MDAAIDNFLHATIKTNGVSLHCVQAGPEDGPLVLLLHGFPEFWYGWRRQISALAEAGYRVWAPDQRGYNLSSHPRGVRAYTIDQLADDVRGLVEQSGRDKIFLVGHDWGAAVSWWFTLRYPELVEKPVILNVPYPAVMTELVRHHPEQRRRSWYIAFFQIPWLPETLLRLNNSRLGKSMLRKTSHPGTFSEEDLERYGEAWQRDNALHTMINWYRAIVRYPPHFPVKSEITVPTLILWGKQDSALISEGAERSLEYCPQGQLRFFDDATHWVQHEKPEEVNAAILQFFSTR